MFNALTGLGWGVITFAIIIGIGTMVLGKFGGAVASCNTTSPLYNFTTEKCQNSSYEAQYTPTSNGWVNINYLNTQLGTTGLAGWTPAIIAFAVGMLILGAFMVNKGGKRQY